MKAMSVIFKIIAVLVFISAFVMIEEMEVFFGLLITAILILGTGVLFSNLGDAFEDIALMRERQKKELISKGILPEDKA